jgi:hypothetical protein
VSPLEVTFFKDKAARRQYPRTIAADSLAQRIRDVSARTKGELPLLKLARYGDARSDKGSLRHDANVVEITGIEADYDAEIVNFDAAVEIAQKAGLAAILYTSPSHTPAAPRWRVLCPTSCDLPPVERARLVSRLNGVFGGILARESWTLSTAYYYGRIAGNPAPQVAIVDGTPIDELDELDRIAIGKPVTARSPATSVWAVTGIVQTRLDQRRLEGLLRRLKFAPEHQRNDVLHWGACRLGEAIANGQIDADTAGKLLLLRYTPACRSGRAAARSTAASGERRDDGVDE